MSTSPSNNPTKGLTSEDIVIITVMAFGFLGGLIILKMNYQPIIVSVMFGTGIASLIYRFLGGIENSTTITLGPVKLVGALAGLIGTAWVINMKLEEQSGMGQQQYFDPPKHAWFGMKKDGSPVTIKMLEDSISFPKEGLATNVLNLNYQDGQIEVYGENSPDFQLGYFRENTLDSLGGGVFNGFSEGVKNFLVTDKMSPEGKVMMDLSEDDIPFKLKVTGFRHDKSHFQLLNPENDELIHKSSIIRRGGEVVKVKEKYFIINVISVNHQAGEIEPYVKFSIGELSPKLELE